ncbi:MAG: hypothetical protein NVS3B21_20340 [Acidimicrobiales bacterium]
MRDPRSLRRYRLIAPALAAVAVLSGCGSAGTHPPQVGGGSQPSAAEAASTDTGGLPPSSRGEQRGTSSPAIGLPDPIRTPGAINPAVTAATIHETICVRGYTQTIRPPFAYTSRLKRSQLDSGYAVGSDRNPADYEEDHLIPLEVGGSPGDERNLWPEPRAGVFGAGVKDALEHEVHERVCDGRMSLDEGRRIFTTDWIAGARSLGVLTPPRP